MYLNFSYILRLLVLLGIKPPELYMPAQYYIYYIILIIIIIISDFTSLELRMTGSKNNMTLLYFTVLPLFFVYAVVCQCFARMCEHGPHACLVPTEVRRGGRMWWNWSYGRLWARWCLEPNLALCKSSKSFQWLSRISSSFSPVSMWNLVLSGGNCILIFIFVLKTLASVSLGFGQLPFL